MHPFHSPYRCHDCDARFWTISRRARWGATAGGLVVLMIVGVVAGPGGWRQQMVPVQPTSVSRGAAATSGALEAVDSSPIDEIIKAQSDTLDRQLQARHAETTR